MLSEQPNAMPTQVALDMSTSYDTLQFQLYQALQSTLSTEAKQRHAGEQALIQCQAMPGFAPLALFITVHETHPELTLAAAICLKNFIRQHWAPVPAPSHRPVGPAPILLADPDRSAIKEQMLYSLSRASLLLRPHLGLAIHFILIHDYPAKWPTLNEQIFFYLQSNDMTVVHAGLLALYEVVKIYQWKHSTERRPLSELIQQVFPLLLPLAHSWMASGASEESSLFLKLILKIYHRSMRHTLDPAHVDTVPAWTHVCLHLVQMLPADDVPRVLKMKKWAMEILYALSTRYGNRKSTRFDPSTPSAVARTFAKQLLPTVLQVCLHLLHAPWVTPTLHMYIAWILREAVRHPTLWRHHVQPHLADVLTHLVFPLLRLQPDELERMHADLVTYLQHSLDDDHTSPRTAALDLVHVLVAVRRQGDLVLHTLVHALPPAPVDPSALDTALHLDALLQVLLLLVDLCGGTVHMDSFLDRFVRPCLAASPFPFLRANALTLASHVYSHRPAPPPPDFLPTLLSALHDRTDPMVAIAAALVLPTWTSNPSTDELGALLTRLLELATVFDLDRLTHVFEDLVQAFPEKILVHRQLVVQQICVAIRQGVQQVRGQEEEEEAGGGSTTHTNMNTNNNIHSDNNNINNNESSEGEDPVSSVLHLFKTLQTFLRTAGSIDAEAWCAMEPFLVAMLQDVLSMTVVDGYDDALETLQQVLGSVAHVTAPLCTLLPQLVHILATLPDDFACTILNVLKLYLVNVRDPVVLEPYSAALEHALHTLDATFLEDMALMAACQCVREWLLLTRRVPALPAFFAAGVEQKGRSLLLQLQVALTLLLCHAHAPVDLCTVFWAVQHDTTFLPALLLAPHSTTVIVLATTQVLRRCTDAAEFDLWVHALLIPALKAAAHADDAGSARSPEPDVQSGLPAHPHDARHPVERHAGGHLHADPSDADDDEHDDEEEEVEEAAMCASVHSSSCIEELEDDEDVSRLSSVHALSEFKNAVQEWQAANSFVYQLFQSKCHPEEQQLLLSAMESVPTL